MWSSKLNRCFPTVFYTRGTLGGMYQFPKTSSLASSYSFSTRKPQHQSESIREQQQHTESRSNLFRYIAAGSAGMFSVFIGLSLTKKKSGENSSLQARGSESSVNNQLNEVETYLSAVLNRFRVNAATVSEGNNNTSSQTSAGGFDMTSESTPWHFKHPPTKEIKNGTDIGAKITLYQFVTCPFCCKVRSYLDYHGINYDVVEVDSIKRTQKKWTKYGKVPILVCDGISKKGYMQINDSSVILSVLESHRVGTGQTKLDTVLSYYPSIEYKEGRKTKFDFPNKYFIMYGDAQPNKEMSELKEEREWRQWVDDNLVHTLSPNAYRTLSEAFESFRWFSEVGDWENCMSNVSRLVCIYSGAVVMWAIGGRLKRRYGLDSDVRQSLYRSINDWLAAIGTSRSFMGGDKPNLADLSVYGVMCSIEGTQAFRDLCMNTEFMKWYGPMKQAVNERHGLAAHHKA